MNPLELLGTPNEIRGFVHKKILGGLGKLGSLASNLPGPAGFFGQIVSNVIPGGSAASQPCPPGFRSGRGGRCTPVAAPMSFSLPPSVPQSLRPSGQVPEEGLTGLAHRLFPGGETGFVDEFGDAVMGVYGAGIEPSGVETLVRKCPKGTVLGNDGICYDRRNIRNSDRMYPRGRRPLLTGGDMRAISQAARAANKLASKQKQLQSIGLLGKSTKRRKAIPKVCP